MTATLKTVSEALVVAYGTLAELAAAKGHTIQTVSVNVAQTDLSAGKVVGTVTVANRARRKFTLTAEGNGVVVSLLGQTRKLAA